MVDQLIGCVIVLHVEMPNLEAAITNNFRNLREAMEMCSEEKLGSPLQEATQASGHEGRCACCLRTATQLIAEDE
jgi:bacterioferritin-associated ferredoxin